MRFNPTAQAAGIGSSPPEPIGWLSPRFLRAACLAIVLARAAIAGAQQDSSTPSDDTPPPTASEALKAAAQDAGGPTDADTGPPSPPPDDEPQTSDPATTPDEPARIKPTDESAATEPTAAGPPAAASSGDEPSSAPAEAGLPPLDAPSFLGVTPGRTTRDELHQQWGEPQKIDRIPGGTRETFASEGFQSVRATVIEDVVDALCLKLAAPIAADGVVQRLQVGDVEPLEVFDTEGRLLGHAFPERGMLFGFEGQFDPPRVFQIVIERINPNSFVARAEVRLPTRYAHCLADLRRALELAPDNGKAHWLLAEVMLRQGQFTPAARSAQRAIELEPRELEYRLTLAKVLCETGDHRQAIRRAREVAEADGAPTITRAKGFCRLGDCVAAAPERDYQQAIDHHLRAVNLAKPLAASRSVQVRRAAKQVLLESYLGAAHDVGHGNWQRKTVVAPKWLRQALAVADDMIQHERAGAETRLRVHEGALGALAGIAEPPDAAVWIKGVQNLGGVLVRQADDPAYKAHLAWRLGVALSDATEIEAARGNAAAAMQLGNTAMAYFAQGETAGKMLPTHDYLRGWLCYRMGAIHALMRHDHQQAVGWYKHAAPLLESPAPPSAAVNTGRHGETFVSMAVSYWEVGDRKEALRLTEQGLKLMEQASAEGQLEKAALAVPYNNLSRMHQALGDAEQARKFSDLATQSQALAPM
jgi:tetratricopeptide (TPR) repeat protein